MTHFFKGCSGQTSAGRRVLEAGRVQDEDGVVDVARRRRDRSVERNILGRPIMTSQSKRFNFNDTQTILDSLIALKNDY